MVISLRPWRLQPEYPCLASQSSRQPRAGTVAGRMQLGIPKTFAKAAEEADEQVVDARDSRQALG